MAEALALMWSLPAAERGENSSNPVTATRWPICLGGGDAESDNSGLGGSGPGIKMRTGSMSSLGGAQAGLGEGDSSGGLFVGSAEASGAGGGGGARQQSTSFEALNRQYEEAGDE